jgi:hypothetical protein
LESFLKKIIVTLGVAAALSGCAAIGPAFAPVDNMKPGQGILYVYRPKTWSMSALSAVFEVDERKATLENNNYAAIPISAGQYKVMHQWKAGLLGNSKLEGRPIFTTITVTGGRATYVRLFAEARSGLSDATYPSSINTNFRWALEEVYESVALPEIQQTNKRTTEPLN